MEKKKIVVVGGVAGGMSFAARYKRLHPFHDVTVIDKGPYVSFANCGLPYALSDVISKRERLLVETKERLTDRFGLNIYPEHEVISVNALTKVVVAVNNGQEYTLKYDDLVLSPGAKPFKLNIPGLEEDDTFVLRNIPDLDKLQARINKADVKSVLVIGAGFIGLEVAENLKMKGLDVTIVEKAPHVLPPLDEEMARPAYNELLNNGLQVFTNNEVVNVNSKVALLKTGEQVSFDLLVMAVGVVAETSFLKGTGIKLSSRGSLLVDERYQTSVDHIYAIGDAILVKHEITGEEVSIALASPANRQGRQLADILAGLPSRNKGSLGTAILKLFSLTFSSTGLNERQAKMAGLQYKTMYLLGNDHATYYPGATPITLKVVYNPETLLVYGAQAFGQKGVDKRIDIIATAIKANYSLADFPELELTYAPPFGTAKDIINLAGYHALNIKMGLTNLVNSEDLPTLLEKGAILVDVRSEKERSRGYIEGSISLPIEKLRAEYTSLPLDKKIILYCESGIRSYNGERILKALGYEASNLNGSFNIYRLKHQERVKK